MTFLELFENAIHTISESPSQGNVSDYEERASYIFATFCAQCMDIDSKYRSAYGSDSSGSVNATYVELSDIFPLSDVFMAPAIYYLCAMLTLDENEEMSDKFFELYSDEVASIQASLPYSCESIEDRYSLI